MMIDSIYLDKFGQDVDTSKWKYYRVSSRGDREDPIEVALLTFPDFQDIDAVADELKARVSTPGETGMISARDRINRVLRRKWGIDRERSTLIGIRQR